MLFLVLAAAVVADTPCKLPDSAPSPDPEAAQTYLEVGDGELAAGSPETAKVAYEKAFRLDPKSQRARDGFLAACEQTLPARWLAEGRRLMDAGDREGAIAIFERLRKGRSDPAAAFFEGICRYEQGEDELARPLFLQAAPRPDLSARASYFLGLIDLREGDGSQATRHFDEAALDRDDLLTERAQVLRGAALRTGRAVLRGFAESGYDSNVDFTPDVRPANADASGGLGLGLFLRPWGLSGPYLRGSGSYLGHPQAHSGDNGFLGAQAGWRAGRGNSYLFAEYGFDASRLGGAPYLYAHGGRAGARWQIRRYALSGVYSVRFSSYQTTWAQPWSGVLQTLEPEIALRSSLASSFALGYHVARDSTAQDFAASFEHGPRAWFRLVLTPTFRVGAEASYFWRSFDVAAPCAACGGQGNGTPARSDAILYLGGSLEKDLGRVTLRLSGGRRSDASLPDPSLSYARMTATFALSYTFVVD